MKTTGRCAHLAVYGLSLALLSAVTPVAGAPPTETLPAASYSFDLISPGVVGRDVPAAAILEFDGIAAFAATAGSALALHEGADELDALSGSNSSVCSTAVFVLLFSVDRHSPGLATPDDGMIDAGVPYNAHDQAARGHQSGDQFMGLALFTLEGMHALDSRNNVLIRNNYDEGGTDHGALPGTSAHDIVPGVQQDTVDAMGYIDSGATYFSTSSNSPSIGSLSGAELPSGAHIFSCVPGVTEPELFASFSDLGLLQDDDVDALVVFDVNEDAVFDGDDRVLFSLAPGSPSLEVISGSAPTGAAADVFLVKAGEAPARFVSAASLGLGHADDNIDALEIWMCNDAEQCARKHGIRSLEE